MVTPAPSQPSAAALGYALAVVAGFITAIQSRVNGELAGYLGSGTSAALVNFTVGLAISAVVVAVTPRSRAGVRKIIASLRTKTLPWWMLTGGALGAFFIAIQATSVPLIGVALFFVALVSGQTASSLIVDRVGLGTAGSVPITSARLMGAAGAAIAVVVAVWGDWVNRDQGFWFLVLLSVVAGVLIAIQQALNGRVSVTAQSASAATFGSFLLGAATIFIVVIASGGFAGSTSPLDFGGPSWTYLGGALGVSFIGIAAFTVPILGVLSFALVVIAAQLLGAIALDLIWPLAAFPVDVQVVLGAAVAVIAAYVGRRRTT